MDELEQRLQSQRLAQPSADLDLRMREAFDAAHTAFAQKQSSRFWLWLTPAAATCSLAALTLVLLPRGQPDALPLVHRIEAEGRLREMLLNSVADHEAAPPSFVVHIDAP